MTQDEMAKFINMQLSDGASWTIESIAAGGTGDSQACFSSGSQPLYVMWPDEAIVGDVSRRMTQIGRSRARDSGRRGSCRHWRDYFHKEKQKDHTREVKQEPWIKRK